MIRAWPAILASIGAWIAPSARGEEDPTLATEEELQEATRAFREAFESAADDDARVAAVRELGSTWHPKVFAVLAQLARHDSIPIAESALECLPDQPFPEEVRSAILSDIEHFRKKRKEEHLVLAIRVSPRVSNEEVVRTLLGILYQPNYEVVKAAAVALGSIGDKGAVPKLLVFLETVFPSREERAKHPPSFNWDRFAALENDVLGCMKALSGHSAKDEEDWRSWYNEKRKEFPAKY